MSTLIEIQTRTIDNRLVVEVIGQNLVISQILKNLENKLSGNVEEVRIVSGNIIHIDKDFENEVWHGKNVVILTNTIEVRNKVTWNVSGKDNNHTYPNKADTDEDGNGKDGADGYAGESGGNVLILAKKIKNPENFTIISNGGKGSEGQDGGNGKDGDNGRGISKYDFDEKFPCAAKLMEPRVSVVRTTILSILEDLADVKTVWYTGRGRTIHDILADLNSLIEYAERVGNVDTDAASYDLAFFNFKENIFIKAVTNQGNTITFSFQYGSAFTNCQAFLLYEGAFGKQGKRGGKFGLGGEGGYPGEITVRNVENDEEFNVIKRATRGQEGSMGKGGLYGKQGKNGWDMGYMDYSVSSWFSSSWPKYRGLNENSKCTIRYYNSSTSTNVWCPYKDKYAEITSETIQHRQQQQERRENESARNINNRQHRAQAIRKRNISQHHILTTYSYNLKQEQTVSENQKQQEGKTVENVEQKVLQTVSENQKQQEEKTSENVEQEVLQTVRENQKQQEGKTLENVEQEVLQTVRENQKQQEEKTSENAGQEVLQTVSENQKQQEGKTLENVEQEVLQTVSENQKQQEEKTSENAGQEVLQTVSENQKQQEEKTSENAGQEVLQTVSENQKQQEEKTLENVEQEVLQTVSENQKQQEEKTSENAGQEVLQTVSENQKQQEEKTSENAGQEVLQTVGENQKQQEEKTSENAGQEVLQTVSENQKQQEEKTSENVEQEVLQTVSENQKQQEGKTLENVEQEVLQTVSENQKQQEEKTSENVEQEVLQTVSENQKQQEGKTLENVEQEVLQTVSENQKQQEEKTSENAGQEVLQTVSENQKQQEEKTSENAGQEVLQTVSENQKQQEEKTSENVEQEVLQTVSENQKQQEGKTLENVEQEVLQTVSENQKQQEGKTSENVEQEVLQTVSENQKQQEGKTSENVEQEVLQTVSENQKQQEEKTSENAGQEVLQTVSENQKQQEEKTLENVEQEVLQTVSENHKQQEEKTMDLSIKRLIMYQRNHKRDNNFNLGTIFREAEEENIGLLLDTVKCKPLLLDNWFQLRKIEVNYSELNELFSIFETVKQTFLEKQNLSNDEENKKLQTIENLLLNKYRFSTLHEIAKQLRPYQEVMDNIKLTPESVVRYLQTVGKLMPEDYILGECEDQNLDQSLEKYDAKLSNFPELLASTYNFNVILYVEDLDYNLVLQNNYNSSSEETVYMLRRGDEFIELTIDKDYLNLEEQRKKNDDLYAKIFIEIESFKQKQEFDNYLKNKVFLSCNSPLENEQLSEEEGYIEEIVTYFPAEERKLLKERIGKIFKYTGQQGILHNMLQRFSSEGRHVSSQMLYYLINSILDSSIEDRKEKNTFRWILAAYPQRNWIDELILLQFENYFKKPLTEKSKWREYLSKTENKDILLLLNLKLHQCRPYYFDSTQCIENILYLLSNILNETVNLEELKLSEWPYALKEKYWICKLTKLLDWQKSDLLTASYHLSSMENIFGTGLVEKFIEILKDKIQTSPDIFVNILSNFHNEKWYLSEVELETLDGTLNINEWIENMQKRIINEEERDIMQLVELMKGNTNTSKSISDNLSNIAESIKSICKDEYMILGKSVSSFTVDDIKNWVNIFKNTERKQDSLEVRKEMLAVIDRAIKLERGFQLRDTQRLAILSLLINDRTLAEVFTGEGKSLIVVAASIMKVLYGEKVHVVTSSSVLAKRDAETNKDIYNLFDINVSHNCIEKIEDRKDAYSENQIVYGDLSHFQRDYLLDKFYGKNILNNHNSKNVIIDEVDSMLLDKGNNTLYLSHDLASLDKLESVYICIWHWINTPGRDFSYTFNTEAIKEAVLNDLYGLIKKEDIGQLDSKLNEQQTMNIWDRLIKAKILDSEGKLLINSIDSKKMNDVLSPEFINYKDRLNYLLKECIEREKFVHVPNHLKPFVEQHLESWINSAMLAFCMKEKEDYTVDVDREGTSPDCNPNIIILDKDTGTDQVNSQWNEALHQFLQLKHGCKLSLQSLKAVFISNVSFFKLYKNLYGITGTLGSQRERNLLKEIHEIDFVTIPTAKSKQFHENNPILCTSKEEWTNRIHDEVRELIEKKKRSVLIICETINDVEILHEAFGGTNAKHVHTYKRDYEQFDIAQGTKKLEQGQIIIATNLAGRGTDIQISEDLKQAGGLHVCLTYLPKNIRIEQQAFGRAARKGDKGSGQLVIIDSKGKEYSNFQILNLKQKRVSKELHRISDVKNYYETQIMVEESCFKAFEKQYVQLKTDFELKKVPTEVIEIMLQSCLDKWAFWLDENSKYIKDLKDKQSVKSFSDLLNKFISQLKCLQTGDDPAAWVDGNPFQMLKLGKYFAQNEECDHAIELFDKVIKQEPYFSEATHYYKAYALSKKIDWGKKPLTSNDKGLLKSLKKELQETTRLLDVRSNCCVTFVGIINKMKTSNEESYQICPYEEQQQCLNKLYCIFSKSIDDILGHFITPEFFVTNDVTEELAEILYEDLLEEGILKKPRVKKDISNEELKRISSDYGVSVRTLKNFLSKYEGRKINEKEFQKEFKEKIQLPSRGSFWKLLIEQKILSEEIKYVVVDNEKLKEVDPSLLDFLAEEVNKKRLEKETVESDNEQIFLHAERIAQQRTYDNIFRKGDFRNTIGENKYQTLKKKGIFSFNKKARIDTSKIKSVKFSYYDSISLEDFTNINITENEAKEILSKLVEQKVIEEKDGSANNTYRLKTKFDEIEQIELPFCPVYEDVVKGLLYTCFIYRGAVERIVRRLEEKEPFDSLPLMTKPHRNLMLELLGQKIIKPVTVIAETENLEEKLKSMYNETTTKHNVKLGPLAKEETIKHVIETLSWSRSALKALKTPDSKLKPLIEFCEFANVEEVHVFFLNGLDQLLKLGEKKWTREMLFNTVVVVTFGIAQITIGSIMRVYSVGFMTHVAGGFMNEGVSDILFAIDALKSGYFSWSDYRQHKIESIAITVASAGIGALLSRGVKVSYYDRKLGEPNLVKKEVIKCIVSKCIEAIVFGIVNAAVDKFIENYLQTLCKDIASAILSDIEHQLDRRNSHNIFTSLERAYRILGKQKAESMICNITKNVFYKKTYMEQYLRLAIKINNSVINGIANAVEKIKKSGATSKIPIHAISKAVVWSMRAAHILDAIRITINILDNLNNEINSNLEKHVGRDSPNQNQKADTDYERFERNTIDHWKSILRDKVGQIIIQHIVTPILQKGANWLVTYVGGKIQEVYRSYKEDNNSALFKMLKKQNEQGLSNINEEQSSNASQTENHTIKEYQEKLIELMVKTRNPDLFADIVLENVPLDLTCVDSCVKIIPKVLEQRGIAMSGLTIIVKGDGGLRQEFSSAQNVVGGKIIEMNLTDNHFQLCGNSISDCDRNDGLKNNCLYEALSKAFSQLRELMGPDEFRACIASYIRQNPEIRNHIQQGHHRVPLAYGAFGGAARAPSRRIRDFDSSSTENEKSVPSHLLDRFIRFIRLDGIIQRISEVKGMDRDTVIEGGPSEFQDRSSNQGNKVHASHVVRGRNINSKLGNDKQYKQGKSEPEYNELRNFLGHTQNVEQFANKWPGIGKDIDIFQKENLNKIMNTDYSTTTPNREAMDTLKELKKDYITILDNHINNGKYSEAQKTKLSKARENANKISVEQLYKAGRDGYLNNKYKNYQEPYRKK